MDRTFTTSFLSRAAITLLLAVVTTATAPRDKVVTTITGLSCAIQRKVINI